jgi:REase_MTES_1575
VTAPTPIPDALKTAPFTPADARKHGLERSVLRGERFRHPYRGVYVWHELPDDLSTLVDAARLILPRQALPSHRTAAALWSAPAPPPIRPSFWVPRWATGLNIEGVELHWYLDRPTRQWIDGRLVTSAVRTFIDMAADLRLVRLTALGDFFVRSKACTKTELLHATSEPRRRHINLAYAAAKLVRQGVDSPQETALRVLLELGGCPPPTVNRDVFDEAGGWLARPDLSYPESKIAIEYDGMHHERDPEQRRRDILRNENLTAAGWIVIVVTSADLRRRPERTLQRVLDALGRRGHPAAPRFASDDWRLHFR